MDNVNIGLAIDIAGAAILLILQIIGAVKAWPYRKTDKQKFLAIYKPYRYWGLGIWLVFNVVGILLIVY